MSGTDKQKAWMERVLGVVIPDPSGAGGDPDAAFRQRLGELVPRIRAAAGSPRGEDAKLKASEAGVFARKKDFTRANALLDEASRFLSGSIPPAAPSPPTTDPREETASQTAGSIPPPPPPPPPGSRPNLAGAPRSTGPVAPRVAFTQSRLIWDTTRKQVQSELHKLEAEILKETADEPDAATIAKNSKILYRVLDFLDERLIDKLDEALNASTEEDRRKAETEARDIVDEYVDYMKTDKLLHDIDDNGFIDLQIQATVSEQLKAISDNLKALGA